MVSLSFWYVLMVVKGESWGVVMTGRTHDLAAFTAISWVFVETGMPAMSLGTLLSAVAVGFLGGLFPDLDNASSDFWDKIPGGSLWGKVLSPLLGGHRMITHSLLGLGLAAWLVSWLLVRVGGFLVVDRQIVWGAFVVGYVSHLVADSVTKEGVPLFFPVPVRIGFPPVRWLRMETGEKLEKYLVYPGLLMAVVYVYASNYQQVLEFLQDKLV